MPPSQRRKGFKSRRGTFIESANHCRKRNSPRRNRRPASLEIGREGADGPNSKTSKVSHERDQNGVIASTDVIVPG